MKLAMVCLAIIFSIVLPITCVIVLKKKTEFRLRAVFLGAAFFILFVLVLEAAVHRVCLKYVANNVWLYAVYGGCMAGIFEETARFIAFRFVLRKDKGIGTGIAYGIGHGGAEVIMLLGLTYTIYLLAVIGGPEGIFAAALPTYESISTGLIPVAMLERISAMILQVALSMIVFISAKRNDSRKFFPIAILLHAMADIPAAFCQYGYIGIGVLEAAELVYGICVMALAIRIAKKHA